MKENLLLIAMPSVHFKRWIENIDQSKYRLYWFDILNKGKQDFNYPVTQVINWKKRKIAPLKGEHFIYKNYRSFYRKIEFLFSITASEKLSDIVRNENIDAIHCFEMQSCTYPLLKNVQRVSLPWLYSCWGSDLYYYKNIKSHRKKIKKLLPCFDALHTDNHRDQVIAKSLGFNGHTVLVVPGGGGYTKKMMQKCKQTASRSTIIIKGYQNAFGRAVTVLKALLLIDDLPLKVVVFGAHKQTVDFIKEHNLFKRFNLTVFDKRKPMAHHKIIALMQQSKIYIGNNISDGIPNTLLEAMLAGAFPIQSNPGGSTEELITHQRNGLLIKNAEDVYEIANHIRWVFENPVAIEKARSFNFKLMDNYLCHREIKVKINKFYADALKSI